jgi:hypothetical protein
MRAILRAHALSCRNCRAGCRSYLRSSAAGVRAGVLVRRPVLFPVAVGAERRSVLLRLHRRRQRLVVASLKFLLVRFVAITFLHDWAPFVWARRPAVRNGVDRVQQGRGQRAPPSFGTGERHVPCFEGPQGVVARQDLSVGKRRNRTGLDQADEERERSRLKAPCLATLRHLRQREANRGQSRCRASADTLWLQAARREYR